MSDASRDVEGEPATGDRAVETPATYALLGALLAAFLVQQLVRARFGADAVELLTIDADELAYVWTWVTSVFVHANGTHVFLNGAFLYFFGRSVERIYGGRTLWTVFLVAGAPAMLLGAVLTGLHDCGLAAFAADRGCAPGLRGASGALLALVGFTTVHLPRAPLQVVPTAAWSPEVSLRSFTAGVVAVSVLGIATPIDPLSALTGLSVSHIGHLTGLASGAALAAVWRPVPAWERIDDESGP